MDLFGSSKLYLLLFFKNNNFFVASHDIVVYHPSQIKNNLMTLKFELFGKVLRILAQNFNKSFTLEELTSIVFPAYSNYDRILDTISIDREFQSKVLDTLILLERQGLINLNSLTDESCIKIKGLIKVNAYNYLN